jgi:DNA processing protein
MNNKPYFLALNRIKHIGPRTTMALLERWPDLSKLFTLSQAILEKNGIPTKIAASIATFNLAAIDTDLAWEQKDYDNYLLTWDDKNYPLLLKEIHDPPIVLYAKGNLTCLEQPTLAMVGTRKPSVTGEEIASRFSHDLSNYFTVVSGLALGIDTHVHQGCLDAKGNTIAVMATGIDYIYPASNRQLAQRIREEGLILTEFPLKTMPNAKHFPRRNRIISGLSLATLVVEAAIHSGSLVTARLAMEQNRDVLAIPGSIYNPQARGCHYLVQQGAKLVTSYHEILDELGITNTLTHKQVIAKEYLTTLATTNENLVKCVGFEITTLDQISQRSHLTVEQVACDLAELELQGIVKAVPGGYTRCN